MWTETHESEMTENLDIIEGKNEVIVVLEQKMLDLKKELKVKEKKHKLDLIM